MGPRSLLQGVSQGLTTPAPGQVLTPPLPSSTLHCLPQSLTVGNVTTLLGPNVGDLQKARSHPIISSWLRSLNRSALSELGLDTDATSPTSSAHSTTGTPSTTLWTRHQAPTSEGPGSTAPSSGTLHPPSPWGGPSTLCFVCPSPPQPDTRYWLLLFRPISFSAGDASHVPPWVTHG